LHCEVLLAEHWPHAPDDSHAGVAPPHSPSPAHARHRCAEVLQTGVVPPHWELVLQLAHTPSATLQTGVAPAHFVTLVAEQVPHAPEG